MGRSFNPHRTDTVTIVSRPIKPSVAVFLLVSMGLPAAVGTAQADNSGAVPHAGVPSLAQPVKWRAALLVPGNYPLDISGRPVNGTIRFNFPNGKKITRKWRAKPHSGSLRAGDRRAYFSYTHAVPIGRKLTRVMLKGHPRLQVESNNRFIRPGFTKPTKSIGSASLSGINRARSGFCSTPPLVLMNTSTPGQGDLPRCGGKVRWRVTDQTDRGLASITPNGFQFVRARTQTGADEFTLTGSVRGRPVVDRTVQIRINPTPVSNISIRAMGDSVTAGFGYFGKTGKPMGITQLPDCKPAAVIFNDACSSNAYNRNASIGKSPDYLPDYGLSRNIAWPAQWANAHGVTDYKNYAVSGSAPVDWLPGGQFDKTRRQIEKDNPDYIVMTMGANPLLSDILFGIGNIGCALESDLFGDFRQCILDAFASVDLTQRLKALYTELVDNTTSRIVLMQYHLAVPAADVGYSAVQIEMIDDLMNETIASEATRVSPERITVITPPRFFVGIDMRPLYESTFSCSYFDFKVDGRSVQADPAQDFLEALHPFSFCPGPTAGPPWTISGDTGIHPSATGYSQMAGQIPAPE